MHVYSGQFRWVCISFDRDYFHPYFAVSDADIPFTSCSDVGAIVCRFIVFILNRCLDKVEWYFRVASTAGQFEKQVMAR